MKLHGGWGTKLRPSPVWPLVCMVSLGMCVIPEVLWFEPRDQEQVSGKSLMVVKVSLLEVWSIFVAGFNQILASTWIFITHWFFSILLLIDLDVTPMYPQNCRTAFINGPYCPLKTNCIHLMWSTEWIQTRDWDRESTVGCQTHSDLCMQPTHFRGRYETGRHHTNKTSPTLNARWMERYKPDTTADTSLLSISCHANLAAFIEYPFHIHVGTRQ